MKNIKKWFDSYNNQTKTLLAIGLGAHIIYTIYSAKNFSYILNQYGILTYLGRASGIFVGVFFPVLIISAIISILPYYIFKRATKKYKKYLDYLSIIFSIVSFIVIYFSFKSQGYLYY